MARPQAPGVETWRWRQGEWEAVGDRLAAEEPLQLSLDGEPLSVIMRTPGADVELALGLLIAERVIQHLDQVARILVSAEAGESEPAGRVAPDLLESNQVDVHLREPTRRPARSFLSSSACGVCGATTIDELALDFRSPAPGPQFAPETLIGLPEALASRQSIFSNTGGLHAAALFDPSGELLLVREDVGRHNAVDKLVGRSLLEGRLPLSQTGLLVSGRAGYELVQKAVAAGIPLMAAVGAPSSLAVATARRFGLTLAGFLRDGRFNVYSGPERLRAP